MVFSTFVWPQSYPDRIVVAVYFSDDPNVDVTVTALKQLQSFTLAAIDLSN